MLLAHGAAALRRPAPAIQLDEPLLLSIHTRPAACAAAGADLRRGCGQTQVIVATHGADADRSTRN
jgi:hypothetical protein